MQTESHDTSHPFFMKGKLKVFWDQSLVWGLICIETLRRFKIPFQLLSAREIAYGALRDCSVLLVPGGWASHKVRALGETGKDQIRQFIENGGSYLGFCGGAGLALSGGSDVLNLVPLERMPFSERLPSASGKVRIRGIPDHPVWKDLPETLPVSVWWPSQFCWQPFPRSLCLAVYKDTGTDFWVADLCVNDLKDDPVPWEEWEAIYGINLNPLRILGHPAILEIRLGRGRLILSYPHLETPNDLWGNRLFLNTLRYLDEKAVCIASEKDFSPSLPSRILDPPTPETLRELVSIRESVDNLIAFGRQHLLWKWRNPWLLQWSRGIRGLEYGTLAVTVRFLSEEIRKLSVDSASSDPWLEPVKRLGKEIETFCDSAKHLLLEEKYISQTGNLSKLGKISTKVDGLRSELFGNRMNHGGLCRMIFDRLDRLLFEVLNP